MFSPWQTPFWHFVFQFITPMSIHKLAMDLRQRRTGWWIHTMYAFDSPWIWNSNPHCFLTYFLSILCIHFWLSFIMFSDSATLKFPATLCFSALTSTWFMTWNLLKWVLGYFWRFRMETKCEKNVLALFFLFPDSTWSQHVVPRNHWTSMWVQKGPIMPLFTSLVLAEVTDTETSLRRKSIPLFFLSAKCKKFTETPNARKHKQQHESNKRKWYHSNREPHRTQYQRKLQTKTNQNKTKKNTKKNKQSGCPVLSVSSCFLQIKTYLFFVSICSLSVKTVHFFMLKILVSKKQCLQLTRSCKAIATNKLKRQTFSSLSKYGIICSPTDLHMAKGWTWWQ